MYFEDICEKVSRLMLEFKDQDTAIELIALCTGDGFPVCSLASNAREFEEDKMAAASSTLYSVSNAVAQQIVSSEFQTTFIETRDGNMAFVAMRREDRDYVVVMSAAKEMNLAKLRLRISRLVEELEGY